MIQPFIIYFTEVKMADIIISTDGTVENTKLTVDGKELTKKHKVVSIDLTAAAPFKGKYSGETYQGGVAVSYTHVDEEGKMKRESFGKTDTNYIAGVGQKMVKAEDSVIIRHIGDAVEKEIALLVDSIISHCTENKISCPDRDALLSRSEVSLRDKAEDLGIEISDAGRSL